MQNNTGIQRFFDWFLSELSVMKADGRGTVAGMIREVGFLHFMRNGINSSRKVTRRFLFRRKSVEHMATLREKVTKDHFVEYETSTAAIFVRKTGAEDVDLIILVESMGHRIDESGTSFEVRVLGRVDLVDEYIGLIDKHIEHETFTVVRDFIGVSDRGVEMVNEFHLTKESRLGLDAFYPNLKESVSELITGFEAASENAMILISEPGCGKSAMFRRIFTESSYKNLYLINDEELLFSDKFIPWFKSLKNALVIVEDMDRMLLARDRDNSKMSAILGVIEGVSQPNVKIMFSTNLMSTSSMDAALLRGGRMYRIIKLGKMNVQQAANARLAIGLPDVDFGKATELTLAEALNYENHPDFLETKVRRAGFGG